VHRHVADDTFRRIDTLIGVSLRLARQARSGRVALARVAAALHPDWIPQPWGEELLAALATAAEEAVRDPLDGRRLERVLRDAWGVRPQEELDELDPEPIAVTPAAQVHRGVLDGTPVAVKVLRPGLAASVRQDVALLDTLSGPLGAAFPGLDPAAVSREIRERVLEELDLEHEASVQRRFHRALRGHPFLHVPAPITRLSHESVLVSEFVDGVPLLETPDPEQSARRLAIFALGASQFGMVHADPSPDNVLVLDDGRLAILDFGATRTVDADRVQAGAQALDAFAESDEAGMADALERLGALPREHAPGALALARSSLGELGAADPSRLDIEAVVAARDRLFEQPEALVTLIVAGRAAAEDLWPARGTAQLFGAIAMLGAEGPWLELARAALRDGWDAGED
jgi:predicted unusual protein kinase regulating ubiquinone biosynthesis (AarF/ABC1/UbiB family)